MTVFMPMSDLVNNSQGTPDIANHYDFLGTVLLMRQKIIEEAAT